MTDPTTARRSFRFTPACLIFSLLVVEGLLWLSERYQWFWFNEKKGWTVLIGVAVVGGAIVVMLGWFIASLVFRWRFQFSIRSMLVLLVAVAVPFSWLAVEMKKAREQMEAVQSMGESIDVWYDWHIPASGAPTPNPKPPQPKPEWLRNLLGADFFTSVVQVNLSEGKVTEARLEHLKWLPDLEFLYLYLADDLPITDSPLEYIRGLTRLKGLMLLGPRIRDVDLENLKGLPQLHSLSLYCSQITDAGLKHLKSLTQLQSLLVKSDKVTDDGLVHLSGLAKLQMLDLYSEHITDAGVEHLTQLTELQFLCFFDTKVTDARIEKLQQALPKCKIYR